MRGLLASVLVASPGYLKPLGMLNPRKAAISAMLMESGRQKFRSDIFKPRCKWLISEKTVASGRWRAFVKSVIIIGDAAHGTLEASEHVILAGVERTDREWNVITYQWTAGLAAILRMDVVLRRYCHPLVYDFAEAVRADEKIDRGIRFQLIFMHGDADVFELRVQRRLATVQYQPFPGPIQFRGLVQ